MVDFKQIMTKEAWFHLPKPDQWELYGIHEGAAHPTWKPLVQACIRETRDLNDAYRTRLGETKWGRSLAKDRRDILEREQDKALATLKTIVEAKWDEDDYMKTVEMEKEKEHKAGDSEVRSQMFSEESEENPGSQETSS